MARQLEALHAKRSKDIRERKKELGPRQAVEELIRVEDFPNGSEPFCVLENPGAETPQRGVID